MVREAIKFTIRTSTFSLAFGGLVWAFSATLVAAGTFYPVSAPGDLPADLWAGISSGTIAGMINALFVVSIGIAALLAVVMIVVAGIQYMGSDSYSSKGAAKEHLAGAIIGLLILLGSWLILNTISPTLVNITLLPFP